jgi:hypothetical protein
MPNPAAMRIWADTHMMRRTIAVIASFSGTGCKVADGLLMMSEGNGKGLKFSQVLLGLSDELSNPGARRSMAAPLNHRLDVLFFSLEECGHRSIGKIANPPGNSVFTSFPLGIIPEAHTLNNPFDDQLGARLSHRTSPRILLQHL